MRHRGKKARTSHRNKNSVQQPSGADVLKPRMQARRQDFAAGGGQKLQEGQHFLNTILDECSNLGVNHVTGGTDFRWGPDTSGSTAGDEPC